MNKDNVLWQTTLAIRISIYLKQRGRTFYFTMNLTSLQIILSFLISVCLRVKLTATACSATLIDEGLPRHKNHITRWDWRSASLLLSHICKLLISPLSLLLPSRVLSLKIVPCQQAFKGIWKFNASQRYERKKMLGNFWSGWEWYLGGAECVPVCFICEHFPLRRRPLQQWFLFHSIFLLNAAFLSLRTLVRLSGICGKATTSCGGSWFLLISPRFSQQLKSTRNFSSPWRILNGKMLHRVYSQDSLSVGCWGVGIYCSGEGGER